MALTRSWQEANPNDDNYGFELDDYQRQTRQDVRERAAVQHKAYLDESGHSDVWEHKPGECTILHVGTKASFPTPATTTKGCVAIATDEGNQVYYWNGSGWLKVQEPVLITGNQTIAGIKTFSSTPVLSEGAAFNNKKATGLLDPTANQDAATKIYVDDNVKLLKDDGTVVFNTQVSSAGVFQELDLSSIVGAKRAMVCLKFKAVVSQANDVFKLKPYGESGTYSELLSPVITFSNGTHYAYGIYLTSATGKLEIASAATSTTFTITLISYLAA